MAPLGNTKEDDYYRNDSPVEVVWLEMRLLAVVVKAAVGGGLTEVLST